MSKYIIQAIVTGTRYYEIEAQNKMEAIKLAHSEYANQKVYTQDGGELTVNDDIDTFTVVDKISDDKDNPTDKIRSYIKEIDLQIDKLENKKLNCNNDDIYKKGEINGQLTTLFCIKDELMNVVK